MKIVLNNKMQMEKKQLKFLKQAEVLIFHLVPWQK